MNARPYIGVLDVGHGNAAVIADLDSTIVIDAGKKNGLLDFLEAEGIREIDTVILSHADHDHIGGLVGLLGNQDLKIRTIIVNGDGRKDSKIWDDLAFSLNDANKNYQIDVKIGLTATRESISLSTYSIELLAPSIYLAQKGVGGSHRKGGRITSNTCSVVTKILENGKPLVLLTGDIDDLGLTDLLDNCPDAGAPVLVFPHHGGRPGNADPTAFSAKLCEAVQPSTVIFSIGRGGVNNPRPEVIKSVKVACPEAKIMCTQLSARCSSSLPSAPVAHLAQAYSVGRQHGRCCAGTILFQCYGTSPTAEQHSEFVRNHVKNPLCML